MQVALSMPRCDVALGLVTVTEAAAHPGKCTLLKPNNAQHSKTCAYAGGPDYTKVTRNLALELVRVTEAAALAGAQWLGKGDKNAADQVRVWVFFGVSFFCILH